MARVVARSALVSLSVSVGAALTLSIPHATAASHAGSPTAALPAGIEAIRSVEGITEYRLANGLQVLLAPDASKPTTTVNVTYRVGSRHESYGETGMAHLLEHLVFKGSPRYPNGWAEFGRRGMRFNGTTWLDRTNYFASFPVNEQNLEWYLGWQADAMVNAFIARKDLDSEMTVVRNEMEIGENNPFSILFEKTLATMYQWHNYGKSTIGARADVEGVDIERLQRFYRTHYQPDNATLVVSGKFDVPATLQMIAKAFGGIPRSTIPRPRLYTLDPVQDGERSVTLRRTGGVPILISAYHVPPGAHPDTAAVELLGPLLTEAPSGRLHQALVATGKAAGVLGFSAPLHDPGFFLLGAQLTLEQDAELARGLLLNTLEGLAAAPLTDAEVERARAKWLRDWDQRFTDPEEVGVALSEFVALGDWRTYFQLRDRVRSITTAEVNRVARSYLVPSNRTLAQYVPTVQPQRAPKPQGVDVAAELQSFKPVATIKQAAAFDASPSAIDARTQRSVVQPGLALSLLPKETRGDAVVARWTFRWGSPDALQGQAAALTLLPALFDKGAQGLSRQQIQDRLNQLRAELGFSGGVGGLQVSVKTTREHLPAVIALVSTLVRQPTLDAASLEEVRLQSLAALQQTRDEPQAVAARALGRHGNPYAAGHPRHVPTVTEWEAQLRAVDVAAVQRLHRQLLGALNAQFSAVGSFDPVAVRQAMEAGLAGWRSEVVPVRLPNPLVAVPPARMVLQTPDKQNAILAFRLALPVQELDPDHAPLLVANYIVGGSENSRLWTRVREKEGLSYGLNTQLILDPFERSSLFSGLAAFAPQNRERVETAFREEFQRSVKEGFTAEEVQRAIDGLLSARRLLRAQDDWLAGSLVNNAWLGRAMDVSQKLDAAITQVTPAAALEAWRRHIRPDAIVWAVSGDFKDLR